MKLLQIEEGIHPSLYVYIKSDVNSYKVNRGSNRRANTATTTVSHNKIKLSLNLSDAIELTFEKGRSSLGTGGLDFSSEIVGP